MLLPQKNYRQYALLSGNETPQVNVTINGEPLVNIYQCTPEHQPVIMPLPSAP